MTVTIAQIAAIAGALLTVGACFTGVAKWLDARFERQIKAIVVQMETRIEHGVNEAKTFAAAESKGVRSDLSAAIVRHDDNSHAHPTHFMTPVIQALQIDIARSITEMRGELKSLSQDVSSLRRAHDEAISKGLCVYHNLGGDR